MGNATETLRQFFDAINRNDMQAVVKDFEKQMDLDVGLTACSAEQSNNYAFKPIDYEVLAPA